MSLVPYTKELDRIGCQIANMGKILIKDVLFAQNNLIQAIGNCIVDLSVGTFVVW